jgi:hypothetical protein
LEPCQSLFPHDEVRLPWRDVLGAGCGSDLVQPRLWRRGPPLWRARPRPGASRTASFGPGCVRADEDVVRDGRAAGTDQVLEHERRLWRDNGDAPSVTQLRHLKRKDFALSELEPYQAVAVPGHAVAVDVGTHLAESRPEFVHTHLERL